MAGCDLQNHPRACAAMRERHRRPECDGCRKAAPSLSAPWKDLGEDEKRKAKERYAAIYGAKAADETKPVPRETIQPKKEETVGTKGKDAILRRIENEKVCNRGKLINFCGVSAGELNTAAKELETEGKIKSWPLGRACYYTLPNAPDPHQAAAKRQRNVKQRQTDTSSSSSPAAPRKSQAISRETTPVAAVGSPPPKNGGGGRKEGLVGDLPAFRRIQAHNLSLVAAMVHEDPEEIDQILEELAYAALDWRRERRVFPQAP